MATPDQADNMDTSDCSTSGEISFGEYENHRSESVEGLPSLSTVSSLSSIVSSTTESVCSVLDNDLAPISILVDGKKPKRRKRKNKPPPPPIRIYRGTFIHSRWDKPLDILEDKLIGVDGGKITFIVDGSRLQEMLEFHNLTEWRKECVIQIPEHCFMIPGFVDCHANVFSYINCGVVDHQEAPSTPGGSSYNQKLKLIHDDCIAKDILKKALIRVLRNGTTCAAYAGSNVESANIILAKQLIHFSQRSFAGMDFYCGEPKEEIEMLHIIKAQDVLVRLLKVRKPKFTPYVVASRPMPGWLQHKATHLAGYHQLLFKAHVGDMPGWMIDDHFRWWAKYEGSFIQYLDHMHLLNDRAVLVHDSHLTEHDLSLISERHAAVVHCPSLSLGSTNCTHLRRLMDRNIRVGLGTDEAEARVPSMLECIRRCVEGSQWGASGHCDHGGNIDHHEKLHPLSLHETFRLATIGGAADDSAGEMTTEETQDLSSGEKESVASSKPAVTSEQTAMPESRPDAHKKTDGGDLQRLSLEEAFRLATLGGAAVLGLEEVLGSFEVGKYFDAMLVCPYVDFGPFDIFLPQDSIEDIFSKFLLLGDDRNIVEIYIGGDKLK